MARSISRPLLARIAAAALLAAALGACAPEPATPLRIALTPWVGYEYFFIAREKGFFEDEGAKVRLVELESPGDSRAAFEAGNVDAFGNTLAELLVCRAQSPRRAVAIGVLDYSNGADVLVAGGTIRTTADLAGRRIGLELGSVDVIGVVAALAEAGLTLRDVKLVNLAQNEKVAALRAGRVDALQCFPPEADWAEALPGMHRLFDSSRIPGTIVDVLIADSAEVHANAGRWAAVWRALDRAQRWAAEHPQEAAAIMAARERTTADAVKDALAEVHIVPVAEQRALLAPGGATARAAALTRRALEESGAIPPGSGGTLVTAVALPAAERR